MKNLFKLGATFVVGYLAGQYVIINDIGKGDVVVNDDEKYVRVEKSKTCGWSYAKVHWKNPQ